VVVVGRLQQRAWTAEDHHQGDQEPGAVASSTATGTARGGHLSRQFRLAYSESPYALMTRRIERAMAGMPSCVAKQVTRPVRNREAPVTEPQLA
jgi:hypothetical protein